MAQLRWPGENFFVAGEPYVRSRNILIIGDSGDHIYGSGCKKHHEVGADLEKLAGCTHMHDLTEVGAHPRRFLELLIDWDNRHLQFALPQLGKPDAPPRFGSDFVVFVPDAHRGLQQNGF